MVDAKTAYVVMQDIIGGTRASSPPTSVSSPPIAVGAGLSRDVAEEQGEEEIDGDEERRANTGPSVT